jgi:hypothetical protein
MKKTLTAYLRFNGFEAKFKMREILKEIRIPVMLPIKMDLEPELLTSDSLNMTPILVFEWYRQLTKFTHEYILKDIIR